MNAGIATDIKQDDQQEFHGRLEHLDDQNSIKQHLVSSYKKNIYPILKAEIHGNHKDPVRNSSLRGKWKSMLKYILTLIVRI